MYLISIDPSIRSTAVTIFNGDTKTYKIGVFSSKLTKKEKLVSVQSKNISLSVFDTSKYTDYYKYDRYPIISQGIIQWIIENIDDNNKDAICVIESASFASSGMLWDIGLFAGFLTATLTLSGIKIQNDIAPSEWKKYHGLSKRGLKKIDYIDYANKNFKDIQFLINEILKFGIKYTKTNGFFEDVIDSFLICNYYYDKF